MLHPKDNCASYKEEKCVPNIPYGLCDIRERRNGGFLNGDLMNLIATCMFSFQNLRVLEIETEPIDYIIILISLS